MKIVEISPEMAREILNSINEGGDRYQPLGLFYLKEGDKFVGIDNSDGNAWTEEFPDEGSCLRWLKRGVSGTWMWQSS